MYQDAPNQSDEDVIRRTLGEDVNAFEILVERYRDDVFRIVMKRIPPEKVEDVAHDIFVRAYGSLNGFKGKSPFSYWLSKIAIRTCYDFWRGRYRKREIPMSSLSREHLNWLEGQMSSGADWSFKTIESRRSAREVLEWAMKSLSAEERAVLELVHLEGYSVREAADILGWSTANVKVRAFRSRKKLRGIIEGLIER